MADKYGIMTTIGPQCVREDNKKGKVVIIQTARDLAVRYNLSYNATKKIMCHLDDDSEKLQSIESAIVYVTDIMAKFGKSDYEVSQAITNVLKGDVIPTPSHMNNVVAICLNEGVEIGEVFGTFNPFYEKMPLEDLYALLKLVKKTDSESSLTRVVKISAKLQKQDLTERAKKMFPLTKKAMFMAQMNLRQKTNSNIKSK